MGPFWWFGVLIAGQALIVTALACLVSYRRMTLKVPHGDGGLVAMKQAIRAHGNATEHAPLFGLEILALSLLETSPHLLGGLVLIFTLARLLHPAGMLSPYFNLRRLGAGLTYAAELAAAVVLVFQL